MRSHEATFIAAVGFAIGLGVGFVAGRGGIGRGSGGEAGPGGGAAASSSGKGLSGAEVIASRLSDVEKELLAERRARQRAEAERDAAAGELAASREEAAGAATAAAPGSGSGSGTGTDAALDPAAVAARLQAIEGEIDGAFLAKDGKKALALYRELATLGKAGWPLAAKLASAINASLNEGNPLGINVNEFYRTSNAGDFPLLHIDAIRNPQAYDAEYRRHAAGSLPWTDLEDVNDVFLRQLAVEQDATVARMMASALADRPDPANVAGLVAALEAQANAQVRLALARALAGIPGDEAARALEGIAATETDPEVRSAAESGLKGRRAGVTGFLITYVAPNSQAEAVGIKEGDILVTYKGVAVTSMEALDAAKATVESEEIVPLALYRDGRTLEIAVKGGQIGINGQMVRPEAR